MSAHLRNPADLDRRTLLTGVQLALRAGIAAAVAFFIASVLDLNFPIFAAVAAIIVTDLDPSESRSLGLRRIIATILGAACGVALGAVLPQRSWAIGAGIAIAMLATSLVQGKDGVRVAGFTCGIVVVNAGAGSWYFAFDRLAETLIGIVVAWAISHAPKLVKLAGPESPKA